MGKKKQGKRKRKLYIQGEMLVVIVTIKEIYPISGQL